LADSTQREVAAEAKLSAIKTPRSLVHVTELVNTLKPFKGTEYTLNTFLDEESNQFTKIVAIALKEAGWIRKQPPTVFLGIPTMTLDLGETTPENVPACVDTGISLRAHAKETITVLQATPFEALPSAVRAALTLRNAIGPSISPPDERNAAVGLIDPKPAEGGPITICVGKKP